MVRLVLEEQHQLLICKYQSSRAIFISEKQSRTTRSSPLNQSHIYSHSKNWNKVKQHQRVKIEFNQTHTSTIQEVTKSKLRLSKLRVLEEVWMLPKEVEKAPKSQLTNPIRNQTAEETAPIWEIWCSVNLRCLLESHSKSFKETKTKIHFQRVWANRWDNQA